MTFKRTKNSAIDALLAALRALPDDQFSQLIGKLVEDDELREDILDCATAYARIGEPTITLEQMKKRLSKNKRSSAANE